MFLRSTARNKNGKEHRYWSLVENKRLGDGRVVQRHVLYLGEINSSQELAWRKSIEVFAPDSPRPTTVALFPEDRCPPIGSDPSIVRLRLSQLRLCRPRQWGACWLALHLWRDLQLDAFWAERLAPSRKGTRWDWVLTVLVVYRLIAPGSEWRLHREWFEKSALADLLDADFSLADSHKLYECHDRLVPHKQALFDHLVDRWRDLFNATFDVLLYDLTSTYFESDPPFAEGDKRRFGYSRDRRSDCVQVVIALIVTTEGFPLAYEVLAGNTADRTTLRDFLQKIEKQYGKARRIWVMDRGIPTEKVLQRMQASRPPVQYVVGTPKGRLSALEKALLKKSWQEVRPSVRVKLLARKKELYVLVHSQDRVNKERAMRRRKLKALWARCKELKEQRPSYENLLMKLGAAKKEAGRVWSLVAMTLPEPPRSKKTRKQRVAGFAFELKKDKLREVFKREGRYLLRTNLKEKDPAKDRKSVV